MLDTGIGIDFLKDTVGSLGEDNTMKPMSHEQKASIYTCVCNTAFCEIEGGGFAHITSLLPKLAKKKVSQELRKLIPPMPKIPYVNKVKLPFSF